ncbi:hypothetical protein SAMN05444279_12457 [Ruegeria intermedia]|uniref:Uncharacterized protein n=1 Tax=Ruegeria intermedia TaxID=996115 RepID=A0A1M5AA63_9RHOB|nr:hypothetical protein [Ruegeria intermedia]SHF27159.1 hypothetical protein SAMN05444279_12457 [Ruegeria intermedia]
MSDSSVTTGVEDVLASIKRLVGDQGRKAEPGAGSRPKPGRLVLSQSLRVSDATEPPAPSGSGLSSLARDFSVDAFLMKDAEFPSIQPANRKPEPMVLRSSDRVYPNSSDTTTETGGPLPKENQARPRDLAGSLSAKIEALEAAIARTEDQWEPDGDSGDEYAGTRTRRIHWDVEAGGGATTAAEAGRDESLQVQQPQGAAQFVRDRGADEPVATDAQATATMEVEELKALIAQVVREELQGALGERITRNIRKLVRREINRALDARELE